MKPITLQRSVWINAPREKVWQAVTDPEKIAQWFAPGAAFSQKGDRICVQMGDREVEVAVVETVDPPRQITTRHLPDRRLSTTYLLEEENGGTRFTVIESGLETLDAEARQKHLNQNGAGWELALANLRVVVEGGDLPHPGGF